MRPEDFMDEEDLADLKRSTTIAQIDKPQEIRDKRDAFHSQASQSATLALPKTLLNDLIGPSTESKGTQLLFAIGWREGKFTESSPFIPPVKQDQTGLGYRQKYQSLQTIAPTPKETFAKTGGSRLIQGRGFGIGAFEDEDDDIDVYDDNGRTASLFSRTIVDEPAATAEQPAACKQQESAVGGLKDFRPASSQRSIRIIQYEPPRVPQSFVPRFQRLTPLPSIGRSQQQQQKDFGPQQRGALLGERPLPKQRPTVASNPSLSSQQPPPPHYHSKFIPSSERRDDTGPSEIIVEQLEPGQALAALSGFIPFPNDPLRQERYKAFLKAAAKVSPLSTYQTLLPKVCVLNIIQSSY
jgi:G patch domain-containing protein 1